MDLLDGLRLRWWGAAPRLSNFIPRLRTYATGNKLLRMILLLAADTADEDGPNLK